MSTTSTKAKPTTTRKPAQPPAHVELPGDIEDLFTAAEAAEQAGALSDWERDFLHDNRKRHAKWGAELYLSEKQLAILERCAAKLTPAGEGEEPEAA